MKRLLYVFPFVVLFLLGCQVIQNQENTYRFGIFKDDTFQSYIVDGWVQINGKNIGTTNNGVLTSSRDCKEGVIEFIPDIGFNLRKEDKITFPISCEKTLHNFPLDEHKRLLTELEVANRLTKFLIFNNKIIRQNAIELTESCGTNNKACETNEIFTTIKEQIRYINDPRDIDSAQRINETLLYRAGDCEDFTILLSSYLENIGVKSILVLTNNHVYTLACGLKEEDVYDIIPDKPIISYNIEEENCYVIDPTLPESYMGYSANLLGDKIAFDPLTREYFILQS